MDLWFSESHTPDVKLSLRVNKQLYAKKSDYQNIEVLETPEFGRVLTLDGNIMLTERDEFIYDEMITHVPMAVHPNIKRVLVIGVGDGGVIKELTRYDQITRIDLVEMDEMVAEACRQYLPENACRLDDSRVHIYYENALKFIRRCENKYDLIISNAVFQWIENLEEFISSLQTHLNLGGSLIFSTFGVENFREIYHVLGKSLPYKGVKEYEAIFKNTPHIIEEEIRVLAFQTPKDILKHIKNTGVNALNETYWTKSDMQNFENGYRNFCSGTPTLTYNPIYIAIK